jgi:hypothetical protein
MMGLGMWLATVSRRPRRRQDRLLGRMARVDRARGPLTLPWLGPRTCN